MCAVGQMVVAAVVVAVAVVDSSSTIVAIDSHWRLETHIVAGIVTAVVALALVDQHRIHLGHHQRMSCCKNLHRTFLDRLNRLFDKKSLTLSVYSVVQ